MPNSKDNSSLEQGGAVEITCSVCGYTRAANLGTKSDTNNNGTQVTEAELQTFET